MGWGSAFRETVERCKPTDASVTIRMSLPFARETGGLSIVGWGSAFLPGARNGRALDQHCIRHYPPANFDSCSSGYFKYGPAHPSLSAR